MSQNLKAVDNLSGGVTISRTEAMKLLAEMQAKMRELRDSMPDLDAIEQAKIADIRFKAFAVRKQMEPLQAENERLIAEHTTLAGVTKIRFSDEEEKSFLARWQSENRAKK